MKTNRREFCRNMVALGAAGMIPTAFCGEGEDWKAAFRKAGFDPDAPGSSYFLVIGDIHAPTDSGNLAAHVKTWNAMEPKPAFLAALGDLGWVNGFFGHRPPPERAAKNGAKSFGLVNEILTKGLRKDVPHVYVIGNHDTYPGEYDRKIWRENFPDQPPYCVQDFCGIRFMKWDGGGDGIVREEQEQWIKKECAAYPKDKPLAILVHQPSVGAVGMERDIGRLSKLYLAGRTGVTWLLAGHTHGNGQSLWDLPGGGKLMVAIHARDVDGWWAYGVRDGQIVARIFWSEKNQTYSAGPMPSVMKSRGEIPLAYQGRTDIAWKCFVGDKDERAARLEIGKTGDNDGAFFYVDKLRYRFPKAAVAPKATRFGILGNLSGKRKTREPAKMFFSADGEAWTEVVRTAKAGLNEFPVPAALVGAKELWMKYDGFGMGGDESIAGFAYMD